MKSKICTKCHKSLNLSSFSKMKIAKDGLAYECKLCSRERNKKYMNDNKEKLRLKSQKYYQQNKEHILKNTNTYNKKNKEKLKEYKKTYISNPEAYNKQYQNTINWRKENLEHHKKTRREYMMEYRKTSPNYILKENVSHYIRRVLNGGKNGSYKKYLGCNIKDYKQYLEQKFTGKMNWDNYGVYWEIDHIIPTSKGGSFHYSNTQPLSITENRSKSNKI